MIKELIVLIGTLACYREAMDWAADNCRCFICELMMQNVELK